MVTNPLAILWIGKATIYNYQTVTDPTTYESKQFKVVIVEDEPCRVSYENRTQGQMINQSNGATTSDQEITLFIRPDLNIPPGSVIEVTQHNRTVKYKGSTQTAVYTNHQEIGLELYEDYA